MRANDADVVGPDGETVTIDSPEVIETLQLIQDLIPYSPDGWVAYNMDDAKLPFLDGCCAMKSTAPHSPAGSPSVRPTLLPNIGAVPIPKNRGEHNGLAFSGLWALGSGENRDAAVEYLKFFYTQENYLGWITRSVPGFVPTYLPVAESPQISSKTHVSNQSRHILEAGIEASKTAHFSRAPALRSAARSTTSKFTPRWSSVSPTATLLKTWPNGPLVKSNASKWNRASDRDDLTGGQGVQPTAGQHRQTFPC